MGGPTPFPYPGGEPPTPQGSFTLKAFWHHQFYKLSYGYKRIERCTQQQVD